MKDLICNCIFLSCCPHFSTPCSRINDNLNTEKAHLYCVRKKTISVEKSCIEPAANESQVRLTLAR